MYTSEQICNRFTGFVAMTTYAPNAKCQRGRLYSLHGWLMFATPLTVLNRAGLKRVFVCVVQTAFKNKDQDNSGNFNSYELRAALHEIGQLSRVCLILILMLMLIAKSVSIPVYNNSLMRLLASISYICNSFVYYLIWYF